MNNNSWGIIISLIVNVETLADLADVRHKAKHQTKRDGVDGHKTDQQFPSADNPKQWFMKGVIYSCYNACCEDKPNGKSQLIAAHFKRKFDDRLQRKERRFL